MRGTVATGCLSIIITIAFVAISISNKYYEKPLFWIVAAPLIVAAGLIIKESIKKN